MFSQNIFLLIVHTHSWGGSICCMHNTYATFTQLRSIINEWTGASIVFFYTNFFLHLSTLSIIHTDNNSLMDALGQLGVQYLAQRCRLSLGSLTPPAQPWWDILSLHCLLSKLFFSNLLFFLVVFPHALTQHFLQLSPSKVDSDTKNKLRTSPHFCCCDTWGGFGLWDWKAIGC